MSESTEGHTVKRYDAELGHVHARVLEMGGLVLDQVHQAIRSLRKADLEAAQEVIDRDHKVNEFDIKIDEELVQIIARRQPVASDLRMIIAVAKAISDLERIGDEAVKIARMTLRVYDNDRSEPNKKLLRDVKVMGNLAKGMMRESLDAFDQMNVDRAVALVQEDEELDNEFQSAMRRLSTFVLEDSRNLGHILNVVFVIKALERIGDHAKNIAEYIVFQTKGKDVRHVSPSKLSKQTYEEES